MISKNNFGHCSAVKSTFGIDFVFYQDFANEKLCW